MGMIQVGKSVRFRHLEGQPPPHRKNDVGRVIGIRMLNTDDTRDLLCTVEWYKGRDVSDVFDWDLEIVENIDSPFQTS
tara:strand:- start:333 stop:566 length:234 start_codon:yes stop_codon:yes gene_type:complete